MWGPLAFCFTESSCLITTSPRPPQNQMLNKMIAIYTLKLQYITEISPRSLTSEKHAGAGKVASTKALEPG